MAEYKLYASRTRRHICNALAELLDEKPFTRITVQDIISRAQIQRSTFYRYFRDKYDAAETINQELADFLAKQFIAGLYQGEGIDLKIQTDFYQKSRKLLCKMMRIRIENVDLPQKLLDAFQLNYKAHYSDCSEYEAYLAGQNFVATVTWFTQTDVSAEDIRNAIFSDAQTRWFARYQNVSPAQMTKLLNDLHSSP